MEVKPGAIAAMVMVSEPLKFVSSTMVAGKAIEVCPAVIVAAGGTISRLVSLELRVTARFVASEPEMLTEYDAGADPSLTCAGPFRRKLVSSLSVTVMKLVAAVQLAREALIATGREPSIF